MMLTDVNLVGVGKVAKTSHELNETPYITTAIYSAVRRVYGPTADETHRTSNTHVVNTTATNIYTALDSSILASTIARGVKRTGRLSEKRTSNSVMKYMNINITTSRRR